MTTTAPKQHRKIAREHTAKIVMPYVVVALVAAFVSGTLGYLIGASTNRVVIDAPEGDWTALSSTSAEPPMTVAQRNLRKILKGSFEASEFGTNEEILGYLVAMDYVTSAERAHTALSNLDARFDANYDYIVGGLFGIQQELENLGIYNRLEDIAVSLDTITDDPDFEMGMSFSYAMGLYIAAAEYLQFGEVAKAEVISRADVRAAATNNEHTHAIADQQARIEAMMERNRRLNQGRGTLKDDSKP